MTLLKAELTPEWFAPVYPILPLMKFFKNRSDGTKNFRYGIDSSTQSKRECQIPADSPPNDPKLTCQTNFPQKKDYMEGREVPFKKQAYLWSFTL